MNGMVAFLGNPGEAYANTRHNVARRLYGQLGLPERRVWKLRAGAHWIEHGGLAMVEPACAMNLSGNPVQQMLRFLKLSPADLLVIHDDTERQLGTSEIRYDGGHRGNNGIRDIQLKLGTADFYRLGIGIGRPERGSMSSHVLGRFAPTELPELEVGLEKARILLDAWKEGR